MRVQSSATPPLARFGTALQLNAREAAIRVVLPTQTAVLATRLDQVSL